MRTILFRGKTVSGEWIHGDLIQRQYSTKIGCYVMTPPTWQDPCGDTVYIEHEVIGDTVGQFTGLKDKNGQDIYEGDTLTIVERRSYCFGTIGTVVYNSDYGGFIVEGRWSKNQHHESLTCDVVIDCEVNQPAGGALNMTTDPKEGQEEEVKAPATETEQEQVPGEETEG